MRETVFTAEPWRGDWAEWDRFVLSHQDSRFCHLSAYHRAIQDSYGLEPRPFVLRGDGRVRGVLPVAAGRSLIFGRKWISMPYGEYGGFLIDAAVPASAMQVFADAVLDAARAAGARSIEINGLLGSEAEGFANAVGYDAAVLDLSPGPDELFKKVFTYEVRKAVKKAESRQLRLEEASDPDTLRRQFYPLHLSSMRRLGVPPHGLRYFLALKQHFGDDLKIWWAVRDGERHAGLLGIRAAARVQIIATVSTPDSWEDRPNDLAHWGMIQWACDAGARWFDFGSVRYEGQRRFKKKWGADFSPAAHWVADLSGGSTITTFDSSSETLSRAGQAWRALVPESAAKLLGPMIRRQLLR